MTVHTEQLPPPEYARHSDDCGCGCQLTNRQWLAEAESDRALCSVDFDGTYTTATVTETETKGDQQ